MKAKILTSAVHLLVLLFATGSTFAGAVRIDEKVCETKILTSESDEMIQAPKRTCWIRNCMTGFRFPPQILDAETREAFGRLPICHAELKRLLFMRTLGPGLVKGKHEVLSQLPDLEYIPDLQSMLDLPYILGVQYLLHLQYMPDLQDTLDRGSPLNSQIESVWRD